MPLSPTTLYTEEAHEIICEAYTYGYPLVLTDVTRQLMTSAASKGGVHRASLNQFVHARAISENVALGHFGADADMLHSIAWLNVAKEPTVLSIPDVHQRHYTMHVMDGWMMAFAALGTRTTGNRKGHFAIVGPRWSGDIPTGLRVVESPTAIVWLMGRTEIHGAKDDASVHKIQQQHVLTPLSFWGHTDIPEQGTAMRDLPLKAPPSEQVARMDASTFFGRLNTLMSDNPPRTEDAPALRRFSVVGVGPGRPFELRDDPVVARSVDGSVRTALARIVVEATKPAGHTLNGWQIQPNNVGPNETDYMRRAVVAFLNPGARPAEDGLSLHTAVDAEGERLTGLHRYVLRFAKGHLPPVNGFWSVAVHNARRTFVQNAIDRHAISSADAPTPHADGSVTLHIQLEPPDKHSTSAWLPAPRDQFTLTMQLHWPRADVIAGTWTPPSVERIT